MNNFTRSFFSILLYCALPISVLHAQDLPPNVTADGNQIYCTGTPMHIVTDFNITDPDDTGTDAVYIQISAGYVNSQDVLSLPPGNPNVTATWNAAAGKLTLHGVGGEVPYADLIAAVEDVIYTNNSANPTGTRNFSITVGAANYLPSTGHYYMFVPLLGITWTNAEAAAAASTYYGLQGYLATLTTQEEAQLCGVQASGNGWIGGSDAAVEGVWRWMTGPEAGIIFWNGGPAGSSPTYAFWNTGEPNNQNNEDYAHITAPGIGVPGSWNDLSITGDATGAYAAQGYLVEYGGMPGDPVLHISASTTISFSKITSNTPASRCGSGTVSLGAIASNSALVHWYSSATGATEVGTGATFTTPVISSTTTYYASPYESGCTTVPRVAVTATVNALPTITTTMPAVSVCQGNTAVLQATPSAGTVRWYTTAAGGTPVGTGTSFTTPAITAGTSYFAEAVSSSTGCVSATRVEITVTPSPQPTVAITAPVPLCGQGTATIQATPSAGVVNWYAAATGGTILATGTTYVTPFLTATTTYYAEAANVTCVSTARQPVTVNVNPIPVINSNNPATVCSGQAATISAGTATGAGINWYDAGTGGTLLGSGNSFTTPSLTTTTSYYAEAVSAQNCTSTARTLIEVTVVPLPTLSVITPVTTCNGSTVTLEATPSAGATINWYPSATGGTIIATGNTFTTPAITANTIYYAEAVNGTCISAARLAVTVNADTLPTLTVTTPTALCGAGTATLQATPSAGIVNWYTAANGGTLIGTGNTITSPLVTSTTTYYAEAVNGTCISAARKPVTITVNASPTVTTTNASICAGGTATISAVPTVGTINWYAAATGGTILATGETFTTPILNATTNYYAEVVVPAGCTASTRALVEVVVTPLPVVTANPIVNICEVGPATLEAIASGGTISWYDAPTGGNLIGTGNIIQSPVITADTTFYAEAENNGCVSPSRVAVGVYLHEIPVVGPDEDVVFCKNSDVELDAGNAGMTYLWSTGETTGTITVDEVDTYWVAITSPFGCTAIKTFTVTALPAPDIRVVAVNEADSDILVVMRNNDPENYEFSLDGGPYQDSNRFNDVMFGWHAATARSRSGCGEDVYNFPVYIIPKYFTPNGDNANDLFTLVGMSGFPEVTVDIFDRYGKMITRLSRRNRGWDGTYNGYPLPATDYWYVVKLDDRSPEIRGHFSLLR
jgi:gliding motility-associated-like protein